MLFCLGLREMKRTGRSTIVFIHIFELLILPASERFSILATCKTKRCRLLETGNDECS